MDGSETIVARCLALHPRLIDLTLDRIKRLLVRMHNPERRLPPVIHVAGTNGKGSTIAFMRAILEAAGLRVHVYTSPHLVRFHERIRLGAVGGGHLVSEERLAEALLRAEALNGGDPITIFEITTAAALDVFASEPADVLLLEVGLGGRGDATNVVEAPACSVIAPIGLDHAEHLGTSLAGIAGEKAGIIKRGHPVVIAPQDHVEADGALRREAEARGGAPILVGAQDFFVHAERGRLVYQDEDGLMDLPAPRLLGRHQFVNAATAIAALKAGGFGDLEPGVIEAGLTNAEWPARLQRLTRGRLFDIAPSGAELWLDGGHNVDGGRAVAAAVADLEDRHPAPLVLVCGMLGAKDASAFLRNFAGLARELVAVPIAGQTSARPPEELALAAEGAGIPAGAAENLGAAFARLGRTSFERAPRILICGSLYLAGEVLAFNGTPPT